MYDFDPVMNVNSRLIIVITSNSTLFLYFLKDSKKKLDGNKASIAMPF